MSWINVQKEIRSKQMLLIQDNIDTTLTATADLAINAGAAFVLALKFAGTHNARACSVIKSIFLKIHNFMNYESQYREYFISRYVLIRFVLVTELLKLIGSFQWPLETGNRHGIIIMGHCSIR